MRWTWVPLLVAVVLLSATHSRADVSKGFYLRWDAGVTSFIGKDGTIGDFPQPPDRVQFDSETGFLVGIGAGYQPCPYFRFDVTVNHAPNYSLDGTYVNDGVPTNMIGKVDMATTTLMGTGYFELQPYFPRLGNLRPYVGIGAGWAWHTLDDFFIVEEGTTLTTLKGDTNSRFAWRVVAGTGFVLSDHIVLDLAYSYADLGKAKSKRDYIDMGNPGMLIDPLEFDVRTHNVTFGIRYHF